MASGWRCLCPRCPARAVPGRLALRFCLGIDLAEQCRRQHAGEPSAPTATSESMSPTVVGDDDVELWASARAACRRRRRADARRPSPDSRACSCGDDLVPDAGLHRCAIIDVTLLRRFFAARGDAVVLGLVGVVDRVSTRLRRCRVGDSLGLAEMNSQFRRMIVENDHLRLRWRHPRAPGIQIAGRIFANRPRSFRSRSNPASGRTS